MLVTVAIFSVVLACGGPAPTLLPDAVTPRKAPVYVALGGSETLGVGADVPVAEAWTAIVDSALPSDTVFLNLGAGYSDADSHAEYRLGAAVDSAPTIATIWLNIDRHQLGVYGGDPSYFLEAYEVALDEIVGHLVGSGATVLVANVSPAQLLPGFRERPWDYLPTEEVQRLVEAYNAVILDVTTRHRAVLVDLHEAATRELESLARGRVLTAENGVDLSTAGHRWVADLFIEALRASCGVTARNLDCDR